jgi:hypothetical protein
VYVKQFAGTTDTVGDLYNGAKNQLPKLDPAQVPLIDNDMLTIAFVPSSGASSIPPPPASVISALTALQAQQASSSTSTPSTGTPSTGSTPTTTTKK